LAALGGVVLVASALRSWAQPAHVPWPSYADGVPNLISHPSDLDYRLAAVLLGAGALVLVVRAWRGTSHWVMWLLIAAIGAAGIAIGIGGLTTVAHDRGFGSIVANDMTLDGFRHGLLNYVELAGAALLCVSPLAALRASRQ
jgi:hypothetical protein